MKKGNHLAMGILLGAIIGIAYGYLVLTPALRNGGTGIMLGVSMGIGMAVTIVTTLQSKGKYRH
jgi:hypothetical protein